MRRVFSLLPIAWLLVLLVLPGVALLLGARQPDLENHSKTPMPALTAQTLRQGTTFQTLDQVVLERLPLRKTALDLRGRIAVNLFGDSTSPDVLLGSDDWLYYRPELRLCQPDGIPAADPADAVDILARTLVASGRRTGVSVVGSKVVVHPQNLRKIDRTLLKCVGEVGQRVHDRLATTPGGIDLQPKLRALERRGTPTFLKSDTHWNHTGRSVFLRAVLDRIRPGLADEARIRPGRTIDRPGDLGVFLGIPRSDRDPTNVATRTPEKLLPPGQVVLIGDSQMVNSLIRPIQAPSIHDRVLPGQPWCSWPQLENGGCDTAIAASRAIIIEVVARNLSDLVHVCWRPVVLAGAQLPAVHRSRWERVDQRPGQAPRHPDDLRLQDGTAAAVVRTTGPDVSDVPRLLRIPVKRLPPAAADQPPTTVTMTQTPSQGPPSPCGTPAQSVQGGDLFLPVPAGRSASALAVTLKGPPGTVLGRPEEIVLDGTPQKATR